MKDVINIIKFNIENIIKNSKINILNTRLKNITLLLKTINENIRKNNEKIYNLSNENKSLLKNNNYIGGKNFQGKKQGFGIQINPSGDKFKSAIFTNDQVSGWGIFEHKDGDIQLKLDYFLGY